MGELDQPGSTFTITCVHDVIGATIMHIHRAPAGANGGVAFDLGDPASPVTATWTGLTPADIAELLAGDLYVNIHTAGRPAGEIRGQILTRTVDLVAFTADGSQVVPPSESASTANCTADLNTAATALDLECTHTLPSPSAAHVHIAPFGEVGPVAFTFPSPASPLSGSMPLTPLQVARFAAKFLYLDIHTEDGGEGGLSDEIRGQIGLPPAAAGTGTIIITKGTNPSGGTGFSFTETITPGAFALDDGQTETFNNVAPGTYTVTEVDPSGGGFTVAGIACDDADSLADPFSRSATIQLAAGEVVTCSFRNLATKPTDDLFVFHLSSDQEVPPLTDLETGGCMGRFDSGASELSIVCTHNVDLPTLMHIHRAPAGANGPVVFDMGSPVSPVIATWSGMAPGDVADLFAGNLYVNIHTSGRPGGVIRGQILERTVDTVAFTQEATQTVPPGSSGETATCTADLNNPADALAVSCTHDVSPVEAAHVHRAERGENGPILFTFPDPSSPFAENVPMTPRAVADFAAGFLYGDIHGPDGGEETFPVQIRGQIAAPVVPVTTGTIRIRKSTSPAGGTGFDFTDDVPGSGSFTLDDGGVQELTGVTAGTYTITEVLPAGYSLTDVSCSDANSVGNPFARTATVNLEAGETVTCTFTNLQTLAASQLFVFHLSGAQEVPPNASTARGGCMGQLDAGAAAFSIVCTHNVDQATTLHIHRAPGGANGPVAFDLGDPISPVEATWTGMTPGDIADLLAGNLYVNIHAAGRPEGEIRGQILPRTVDNFFFQASGDQEVPPTGSTATGQCFSDLNDGATSLFVSCDHDVVNPTVIHLHSAPPGSDGPVVFHFGLGAHFEDDVPMSPRLVADFAAGFLYVNIHTADSPEGEIRGQLIAGAAPPAAVVPIPTLGEWATALMLLSLLGLAWWRMR